MLLRYYYLFMPMTFTPLLSATLLRAPPDITTLDVCIAPPSRHTDYKHMRVPVDAAVERPMNALSGYMPHAEYFEIKIIAVHTL